MLRSLSFAALALCACGGSPPRPARLDPSHAASIRVATVGHATTFCPGGEAPQLDVAVATTDGKVLDSWTQGEDRAGRLPFATTFEWTTTWGQVDADGYLRLPADPIAAIDREVKVEIRVTERPDLVGDVTLAPDFGCGGSLGAAGAGGASGESGGWGEQGRPGGGDDGQHAAAAGERGGGGGHGGNGGDGGPGPRVQAWVGYVTTAGGRRFAALRVVADGGVQTTIFDPTGQRWAVVAFGGSGGSGGGGGSGGSGGAGGSGRNAASCSSSSSSSDGSGSGSTAPCDPGTDGAAGGDGGDGGDGGSGGDGGVGGTIELVYDAAFPELADLLILDTRGGAAGSGGYGGSGGDGGSGGGGARTGYQGRSGSSGRTGVPGHDGPPGPAPIVRAGDVRQAFAELAPRGLSLATPGR